MRFSMLLVAIFFTVLSGCNAPPEGNQTQKELDVVADRLYWPESEGNLAVQISSKFNSRDDMTTILSLKYPLGYWKIQEWTLADVLVSMELNANGDVAVWVVSGPKPLMEEYVNKLMNMYKQDKVLYDFSFVEIDLKPTAYFEK